jgi:Xaa-Pro dipeptidase
MPAANFIALQDRLSQNTMVDISGIVREIRSVKSVSEIEKIRFACDVTAAGFDYLLHHLHVGMTEREACKAKQCSWRCCGWVPTRVPI